MEAFFTEYEYTLSALGVLATFIASVVAIWIALRKPRPSVEIRLEIKQHGEFFAMVGSVDFYFVVASIHNKVTSVVEIQEDSFRDGEETVYPLDVIRHDYLCEEPYPFAFSGDCYESGEPARYYPLSENRKMKDYPVVIQPSRSQKVYLYEINSHTLSQNDWRLPDYKKLKLVLDSGHDFEVTCSQGFKEELESLVNKLKTEKEKRIAQKKANKGK